MDLSLLWDTENSATLPPSTGAWDEIIHQLTARSVITDFENMAEKETDIEVERGLIGIRVKNKSVWVLNQIIDCSINIFSCLNVYSGAGVRVGPSKRYRMKAIQTSKSCGIVCMYTS